MKVVDPGVEVCIRKYVFVHLPQSMNLIGLPRMTTIGNCRLPMYLLFMCFQKHCHKCYRPCCFSSFCYRVNEKQWKIRDIMLHLITLFPMHQLQIFSICVPCMPIVDLLSLSNWFALRLVVQMDHLELAELNYMISIRESWIWTLRENRDLLCRFTMCSFLFYLTWKINNKIIPIG